MATPVLNLEETAQQQASSSEATPVGQMNETNPNDLLQGDTQAQMAIKDLCKYFIGLDKWVRRNEVIEARRQRFYWRNDQYIYWKSDAVGFLPAIAGQSIDAGTEQVNVGRYTDVYNIYTPYGESILSTLIQNPPGVNWQPLDPANPKDVVASKTAEKFQQKIENDNNRKELQSTVSRFFYTDGRTILKVEHDDKKKKECITAHGVLETKVVPITSNCIEDLIAVFISEEIDVYQAKGEFPDYAEKIKEKSGNLGESAYERIARLGVLQGTRLLMQAGDAFEHMVTKKCCYLRPSTFDRLPDEQKEKIKGLFPNGLKAWFCGDEYCGSSDISMDDELTVGFPGPGDGMSRPSIGKRMVPLQDVFNDELNLWHEAHDYCIPSLFMYSETGDLEAINEQISQPGNIIPFTSLPPGASSAESAFYAAVIEGIPATLPNLIQFLQGPLAQFISGAFPALFGGDTGDNDTAKGIAIQRDQAMGRMSLPWASLQQLFAGAYTNAVKSAVKYGEEDSFSYTVKDMTGAEVTESLQMDDLSGGSAICKADTDASFPESTNSKRAAYQTMMAAAERNPILAGIMSDPNNLEFGHEVIGLPDLRVPGADSRNKQLIEIKQLLAEPPIPPNMQELTAAALQNPQLAQQLSQWEQNRYDPNTGQPTPPPIPDALYKPSISVDADFDNHEVEYQTVADWLNTEERRREQEEKGNTRGILNVRLHGLAHKALIPPPPMPEPPAGHKSGNPGPSAAGPILHGGANAQGAAQ